MSEELPLENAHEEIGATSSNNSSTNIQSPNAQIISSEKTKLLRYKVIVVSGKSGGATSLINRMLFEEFYDETKSTQGMEAHTRRIAYNHKIIEISFFDISSRKKLKPLRPHFYKGATVAIVVFSLVNEESFFDALQKIEEIIYHAPYAKLIIVGTHKDLIRGVQIETGNRMRALAKEIDATYIEVSNVTGENIDILHSVIMDYIIKLSKYVR